MSCNASTMFNYVVGDNLPALVFQYLDADGNPVDLTSYAIEMHIEFSPAKTVTADIYDPTNGYFRFIFADGDLSEAGQFNMEVQITNASSQKLTIQDMGLNIADEIA